MITRTNRTTLRAATALVSAAALIGVSAAPALAHSTSGRSLKATMSGANEVSATGQKGVGDPDGTGTARISINSGQNRLCFTLRVKNIDTAVAAHIHEAKAGVAGPIVVSLKAPDANGLARGCVKVKRAELKDIRRNPKMYYVNVHNAAFPGGAVRGQLQKR